MILFISGSTAYFNKILMVTDRNYILPFFGGEYSWSYFPLFPWITYPLVGFLFQKKELLIRVFFQNNKAVLIAFLTSAFILVALFSRFGIATTINLPDYYHHTFPFFLWTIGIDVLWILLLWLIVQQFHKSPVIVFLQWLRKNITVFYIIQWLIIGNIATAIYQTQELTIFKWWFIAIFLATVGITFIHERIKAQNNFNTFRTMLKAFKKNTN